MIYPIRTVDELKAEPYSEFSQTLLNMERGKRTVYCQYCKYSIETSIYGVKCGQCRSFLIEYTMSHFDNGTLNNR